MMQDRSFPEFAKLLLKMVCEEKKGEKVRLPFEKIFIEIEKLTKFQEFVDKNYLNIFDLYSMLRIEDFLVNLTYFFKESKQSIKIV